MKKIKSLIVSKAVFDVLVEHSKMVVSGPHDALATVQRVGAFDGVPVYRDPFLRPNQILYTYEITDGGLDEEEMTRQLEEWSKGPDGQRWTLLSRQDGGAV